MSATFSRPLAELLDPLLGVTNEGLPCIHFKMAILCAHVSPLALVWIQLLRDVAVRDPVYIPGDVTVLQQFNYISPRSGAVVYVEIALCCGLPTSPAAIARWTSALTACTAVVVLACAEDTSNELAALVAHVSAYQHT